MRPARVKFSIHQQKRREERRINRRRERKKHERCLCAPWGRRAELFDPCSLHTRVHPLKVPACPINYARATYCIILAVQTVPHIFFCFFIRQAGSFWEGGGHLLNGTNLSRQFFSGPLIALPKQPQKQCSPAQTPCAIMDLLVSI